MTIQTISALKANIDADLADNSTGDVSPADVRTNMDDTVDTLYSFVPDTRVVVKEASELAGDLSSSVTYVIDGIIDMGTTQIKVPETGLNIDGENFDNSQLFSTEDNYTMFVKEDAGAYAGYLRFKNLGLHVEGTNSQLLDLDNNENSNSIEFSACNIGKALFTNPMTSIGEVSNYRLVRFSNDCGFLNVQDGLTLSGTMSGGLTCTDSIALNLPAMTLFKEGTALVINGDCGSNMNFNFVNSAAEYCNFQESDITNDGSFALTGFRTTADDAIPNIAGDSTKAIYRFCQGIVDTYVGGKITFTTEAVTTIPAVDTPTKAAGTTTASNLSSFDMPQNGRLRYISTIKRQLVLEADFGMLGGNGDNINIIIKHFDSADTLISDIDTSFVATMDGGLTSDDVQSLRAKGYTSQAVEENDYFEVWVQNVTDASNCTAALNSKLFISER